MTLLGLVCFCACQPKEEQALLKVNPSAPVAFKASGNEDVLLNVETNQDDWKFEAPEWITAQKKENTLTINAAVNTGKSRAGKITFKAGVAEPVSVSVVQAAHVAGQDYIAIDPASKIEAKASDNALVEITVESNLDNWEVVTPTWIHATKDGNICRLEIEDNFGASRTDRVIFKAGNADPATLTVSQAAAEGGSDVKFSGALSVTEGSGRIALDAKDYTAVERTLVFTLEEAATETVTVQVSLDAAYVPEYNKLNRSYARIIDESLVSIENDGEITISAGQKSGSVKLTLTTKPVYTEVLYLIPCVAKPVTGNVSVKYSGKRADLEVFKPTAHKLKNMVLFETNETNPLNALEYVLEDGQMFMDCVVLFSGNIRWNDMIQTVYMHGNKGISELLSKSDEFIQPLRERGIKVLLSIMGDHDGVGITNLTEYGSEMFAKDLAQLCLDYKIDGFYWDDEYSEIGKRPSNKWFSSSPSSQSVERTLYLVKKYMDELVPWPTMQATYAYGGLTSVGSYKGTPASEFVDVVTANYGESVRPLAGGDLSMCSCWSTECNKRNGGMSEDNLKSWQKQGYGWAMYFCFNPVYQQGGIAENLNWIWPTFENVARGCYEQTLARPTGYYLGSGNKGTYDSTRYTF